MKFSRSSFLLLFLAAGFVGPADGQRVRLRSQIAPDCGSASNLKFADIYGDGNIAVQGSYDCRGVFIYDISNPDAPVLASWYNPGGNLQFLEAIVVGSIGYFGSGIGGGGVHIVDLSDPYRPALLGVVGPSSGGGFASIHEMVVFEQNSRRFLVENFNGFNTKIIKVIDVTNPANPVFVRDLSPTEVNWVHSIHIRGNRMFTSGWGSSAARGRTEIYDISDIAGQSPPLLGAIEDPGANVTAGNNMHSSWTSEDGNYLYSARETNDASGDIRVYDIRDVRQPLLVNSLTMTALGLNAVTPHNPVVRGTYLYVSWYQAGIQVFDISDPAAPKRVGQYDTFPAAFTRPPNAERAYLSNLPWDLVCGSERLQNALPNTFYGAWAVYPFLGPDKVLAGDLKGGLLVLDATGVSGLPKNIVSDFDGDHKTDFSVFSPASGSWNTESSSSFTLGSFSWGVGGDVLVPGDYDGDGKADLAVWRPSNGRWYVKGSSAGFWVVDFGMSGDVPVPADYDADGKTDIAVWRPTNGNWYILQSLQGYRIQQWGVSGDKVMAGDFEGDGKADLAVWRPSNGVWYIIPSSTSIPMLVNWGQNGDKPLVGDFDGDGRDEFTVLRPSNNLWYILNPTRETISIFEFGEAGDIPTPADYDGDGKTDVSVFRPSTNVWFRLNSSDNGFVARSFGQPGDRPSPASVQPQ